MVFFPISPDLIYTGEKVEQILYKYSTNLTSYEICSLAIVGILTADVYTENLL